MTKFYNFLFCSLVTLSGLAQSPGGVTSGLEFWIKSDANDNVLSGGTILEWENQATNTINNAVLLGTNAAPINTLTNLLNYNNSAQFNGPGTATGNINYETTNLSISDESTILFVTTHKPQVAGGSIFRPLIAPLSFEYFAALNNPGYCLGLRRGMNVFYGGTPEFGGVAEFSGGGITSTAQHLSTLMTYPSSGLSIYDIEGGINTWISGYVPSPSVVTGYQIGGDTNNYYRFITTDFGELVIYNRLLTPTEKLMSESYLAIKYGITLTRDVDGDGFFGENVVTGVFNEGDYLASNSQVIWNSNVTPAYHNDIIGIGRDDASGLLQKQSHTLDDTTRIYSNTLEINNSNNTGTFSSDISYITIGHDRGNMFNTSLPASEIPSFCGIYSRLQREWKVTRTNNTENFNWDITIPNGALPGSVNPSDLRLLIDNDGNFSNGGTSCFANGDGSGVVISYQSPVITVSNISSGIIPDNSTLYMTIASVDPATPLPVELNNFTVHCVQQKPELNWSTSSELNNDYFTIERSRDLNHFETIAFIPGAGNSSSGANYKWVDASPFSGTAYYRLSQTDFDGTQEIHQVRSINCTDLSDHFTIYPSPFQGLLVLKTDEAGQLDLVNQLGQVVYTNSFKHGESVINTEHIASGSYIAKFHSNNGNTTVRKVVKF